MPTYHHQCYRCYRTVYVDDRSEQEDEENGVVYCNDVLCSGCEAQERAEQEQQNSSMWDD